MSVQSFDFILGSWLVENRRRADYRDDAQWDTFESLVVGESILGGRGVLDQYTFPQFPGRGLHHGICLRLRSADDDSWRVWWASSASGLGEPLVGGFADGEGRFAGEERVDDAVIEVRTRYFDITEDSFEWEQHFSFDGGRTHELTWAMSFARRR